MLLRSFASFDGYRCDCQPVSSNFDVHRQSSVDNQYFIFTFIELLEALFRSRSVLIGLHVIIHFVLNENASYFAFRQFFISTYFKFIHDFGTTLVV